MPHPTIATATPQEIAEALAIAEKSAKHADKHCKWCHAVFRPTRLWQEFCKPACRRDWHNNAWQIEAALKDQRIRTLEKDLEEARREVNALRAQLRTASPEA